MKKQTKITLALALTPPSLLYGQEYPERSHQHCHVEVEADCSNSLLCLAYSRKIASTCIIHRKCLPDASGQTQTHYIRKHGNELEKIIFLPCYYRAGPSMLH